MSKQKSIKVWVCRDRREDSESGYICRSRRKPKIACDDEAFEWPEGAAVEFAWEMNAPNTLMDALGLKRGDIRRATLTID